MSSVEMIDSNISLEEDRGENVFAFNEVDEKENKVGASRSIGSLGIEINENPLKSPSKLTALRSYNTKYKFSPLSPVHHNAGINHANNEGALSKSSGARSRQQQIQKVVGSAHRRMTSHSPKICLYDDKLVEAYIKEEGEVTIVSPFKEDETGDNFVLEEEDSMNSEVAIFAAAQEEEQLRKIMNDHSTHANADTSNKTILNQSKKLVGFLGGSIRTALQHNSEADVPLISTTENIPDGGNTLKGKATAADDKIMSAVECSLPHYALENPSLQKKANGLNNLVEQFMGKLGSINPSPVNNNNDMHPLLGTRDSTHHENSQAGSIDSSEIASVQAVIESSEDESIEASIDEEADKYTKSDNNPPKTDCEESPISQPKSKYWETLILRSEEPKEMRHAYFESPSPSSQKTAKETIIFHPEKDKNQAASIVNDKPAAINHKTPILKKRTLKYAGNSDESMGDKKPEEEPSPQSMISIPEDYSPGDGGSENRNSSLDKGITSWEDSSPGSFMYSMISAATDIETPLVCKSRRSITDEGYVADSSPFGNMLSSATASQTPQLFKNKLATATHIQLEAKRTPIRRDNEPVMKERPISKTEKHSIYRRIVGDVLDITPVKSNTTEEVFQRTPSDYSLQSDCDESEDGSIYTSLSHQSSIQSNTPRSRKVMEWIGPNASNTVSWPVPSMTTNLRSSETPERQLPVRKISPKANMMGTGQYLTVQNQLRAKRKSSKKSDWRVPRPLQVGNSTSPTSLPSLLGGASYNEISDLESPNITMPPLNFKFSYEDSTIQSQSVCESSEIHSVPDIANLLRIASPQSLMTVATPTVGYPTDEECSKNKEIPQDITNIHNQTPLTETFSMLTSKVGSSPHSTITNVSFKEDNKETPKHVTNIHHPPTLTETFSMLTSKGSSSPHSTITNGSFKQDKADEKIYKYSECLRRCILFGMLVAIAGACTVLAIIFTTQTKEVQPANSEKEQKNDNWSPTSNINLFVQTVSPTVVSSSTSTSTTDIPTYFPTLFSTLGLESSSTDNPNVPLQPALKPSASSEPPTPKLTSMPSAKPVFRPTIVVENSPTVRPTNLLQPTSMPSTIPKPSAPRITAMPFSESTLGPTSGLTTVFENSPTASPTSLRQPTSMPSSIAKPSVPDITSMPSSESTLETTFGLTTVIENSPTVSPTILLRPTSNPELDMDPSFKFKPTSKPTSKFNTPDITWNIIVNGEDVWRKSEGEIDRTPLWYHAADDIPGIELKVINAAKGDRFSNQLRLAIDDYSRSKAVSSLEITTVPYEILCAPPEIGEIKVCSGKFENFDDNADWIGSSILFMRGDYIVSALIRINESTSPASDALLQYALCHQVGHSLGLRHNNADIGLSSCMKDFGENVIVDGDTIRANQKLQHPNSDDLDYLTTLYGSATSRMLRGGRN